jgi:hypothetical protein
MALRSITTDPLRRAAGLSSNERLSPTATILTDQGERDLVRQYRDLAEPRREAVRAFLRDGQREPRA